MHQVSLFCTNPIMSKYDTCNEKLKKGILKKNMAAKNAVFYHRDMVAKL